MGRRALAAAVLLAAPLTLAGSGNDDSGVSGGVTAQVVDAVLGQEDTQRATVEALGRSLRPWTPSKGAVGVAPEAARRNNAPNAPPTSTTPPRAIFRNDRVSPDHMPGSYSRLDGTTDAVHTACSTNRRQQAEPSVAINPRDPRIVVAAAMDACIAIRHPIPIPQPQHWAAIYRSTDQGRTWSASLLPAYPGDLSASGVQATLTGCQAQADVTMSFDLDGRLFLATLCPVFPQSTFPVDFRIGVATFEADGSRFVRQVRVDAESDPLTDAAYAADKPNLAVDQTNGPHRGNVYVAWVRCPRIVPEAGPESIAPCVGPEGELQVARSTDHGATFEAPVTVGGFPDGTKPTYADLAVGPDGALYLSARTFDGGADAMDVWVATSIDGAQSFSDAIRIASTDTLSHRTFNPEGANSGFCGDGSFSCPNGVTFPLIGPAAAVAADETGVHVVWGGRLPTGQGKIFVRNSPDGTTWNEPAFALDRVPRGHQWYPDIASADGVISVVFYDSRRDQHYSPHRPAGTQEDLTSSGPALDVFLAQSRNGGRTWTQRRLTTRAFEPNLETYLDARLPWLGDYLYVSAVKGGGAYAVWTDTRDVVKGTDTRPDSRRNGFDVHAPCAWIPATVNPPPPPGTFYLTPQPNHPCFDQGGLDVNIYGARIPPTPRR